MKMKDLLEDTEIKIGEVKIKFQRWKLGISAIFGFFTAILALLTWDTAPVPFVIPDQMGYQGLGGPYEWAYWWEHSFETFWSPEFNKGFYGLVGILLPFFWLLYWASERIGKMLPIKHGVAYVREVIAYGMILAFIAILGSLLPSFWAPLLPIAAFIPIFWLHRRVWRWLDDESLPARKWLNDRVPKNIRKVKEVKNFLASLPDIGRIVVAMSFYFIVVPRAGKIAELMTPDPLLAQLWMSGIMKVILWFGDWSFYTVFRILFFFYLLTNFPMFGVVFLTSFVIIPDVLIPGIDWMERAWNWFANIDWI